MKKKHFGDSDLAKPLNPFLLLDKREMAVVRLCIVVAL